MIKNEKRSQVSLGYWPLNSHFWHLLKYDLCNVKFCLNLNVFLALDFPASRQLLFFPQFLPEPLETKTVVPSLHKVQEAFLWHFIQYLPNFKSISVHYHCPVGQIAFEHKIYRFPFLKTRVHILTMIIMQIAEDFSCYLDLSLIRKPA